MVSVAGAVSEQSCEAGHTVKDCDIFAVVSLLITFAQHFNSVDLYLQRVRVCVCACLALLTLWGLNFPCGDHVNH